jgi:hypothetical protein
MIQVLAIFGKSQQNININFLKTTVKQRLQDQFIQQWFSDIDNASRGELYSHLKKEIILEPYLLRLKRGFRTVICKLRTCNTKFPIETGRWQRVPKTNERICKLCRTGSGDEFHYICLCNCDEVKLLRQKYIPRYYLEYPHVSKLHQMFKNCNRRVLTYLYKYYVCCVNTNCVFYLLVPLISIPCIVKMYVCIAPVTQLQREQRVFCFCFLHFPRFFITYHVCVFFQFPEWYHVFSVAEHAM